MADRPTQTPEDDAEEAGAWTQAFSTHQPDPNAGPFTDAEKEQLRDLMVDARLREDDEFLGQLEQLAKDPAAYRRAIAGLDLSAD